MLLGLSLVFGGRGRCSSRAGNHRVCPCYLTEKGCLRRGLGRQAGHGRSEGQHCPEEGVARRHFVFSIFDDELKIGQLVSDTTRLNRMKSSRSGSNDGKIRLVTDRFQTPWR